MSPKWVDCYMNVDSMHQLVFSFGNVMRTFWVHIETLFWQIWSCWIFQQWICAVYVYSAHTEIKWVVKVSMFKYIWDIKASSSCSEHVHVCSCESRKTGERLWYHLAKGTYPSVSLCMSIWHEWTSWKWHGPVERREWSVGSSCSVCMYLRGRLQALWFLRFRCINRPLLFHVWLLL